MTARNPAPPNRPRATHTIDCPHTRRSLGLGLAFLALAAPLPCAAQGMLDPAFRTDLRPSSDWDAGVYTIEFLGDGKMLVAGKFRLPDDTAAGVARLFPDGTVDASFGPVRTDSASIPEAVTSLVLEADGGILIGGGFESVNGQAQAGLARLSPQGALDPAYRPSFTNLSGGGVAVSSLLRQAPNKILVAGRFDRVQGHARTNLVLLHPDGAVDESFRCDVVTSSLASMGARLTLRVQADGQVLVAGPLDRVGEEPRQGLARIDASGAVDLAFAPRFTNAMGFTASIGTLGLEPNGGILVAGEFDRIGHVAWTNFVRLRHDGTPDLSFSARLPSNPGGGSIVDVLLPRPDGRILVGGSFQTAEGTGRTNLARWHWDGTLDPGFDPRGVFGGEWDARVRVMKFQADGGLVVGGWFSTNSGGARNLLLRFQPETLAPPSITRGPADAVVALGDAVTLGVEVEAGFDPVFQWQFNGVDLPGATFATLPLAGFRPDQVGDYRVIVRNAAGVATSAVARVSGRLPDPGALDPTFRPLGETRPSAATPGQSTAYALQPDGKILVGGWFTSADAWSRTSLIRLSANGQLDAEFQPLFSNTNVFSTGVDAIAVEPGGAIVVAGEFTHVNGLARNGLARLTPDGRTDEGFDPGEGASFNAAMTAWLQTLTPLADGTLLVGGTFAEFDGVEQGTLVRLKQDGKVDLGFRPVFEPIDGFGEASVQTVAIQPDQRILVGGWFGSVDGLPRPDLARLLADGRVDPSFDLGSGVSGQLGAEVSRISALHVQADGRILIGGIFTNVNGSPRWHIARLESDGAVDPTFAPIIAPGTSPDVEVRSIAPDQSGGVVIAGSFGGVDGRFAQGVAALGPEGAPRGPFAFDPPIEIRPTAAFVLPDGRYLIGGEPGWSLPGQPTYQLVRVRGNPVLAPAILAQPVGATRAAGESATLSVEATDHPLTSIQWQRNGVDLPGATGRELHFPNLQAEDAGDYRVVLRNALGTATSAVATLVVTAPSTRPGAVDPSFFPGRGLSGGEPGEAVTVLLALPDGGLLAGGNFESFDGIPRRSLVRLRENGSVDPSFNADLGPGSSVAAVAPGTGQRFYVAGRFVQAGGGQRTNLVRLESHGALDPSFAVALPPDSDVRDVVELRDGGVIALVSLAATGPLLLSWSNAGGPGSVLEGLPPGWPARLKALGNGGFLLVGDFAGRDSEHRRVALKFHSDGTQDPGFLPEAPTRTVFPWIDFDASGRIYAASMSAGSLPVFDRIYRFLPDGTPDGVMVVSGFQANQFLAEPDGRILLGTWSQNPPPEGSPVFRVDADGRPDDGFGPTVIHGGNVFTGAFDAAGRGIIGGDFTRVNNSQRFGLARLWGGPSAPTAPTIEVHPAPGMLRSGADGWLRTSVHGFPRPRLQWRFNGVDLPGATNAVLLLPAVSEAAAGHYTLVAVNEAGSTESPPIMLSVPPALRLLNPTLANGTFSFDFQSEPGRLYQVEARSTFDPAESWFFLDDVLGDGTLQRYAFPPFGGEPPGLPPEAYFRLEVNETMVAPASILNLKFTFSLEPAPDFLPEAEPMATTFRSSTASTPAWGGHPSEGGTYAYTRTGPDTARISVVATNDPIAGLERTFYLRFATSTQGSLAYLEDRSGHRLASGVGTFTTTVDIPPDQLVPARITSLSMWFTVSGPGCATSWRTTFSPYRTLTRINSTQATIDDDDPCDFFGPSVRYTLTFTSPTGGFFNGSFYSGVFSVTRAP